MSCPPGQFFSWYEVNHSATADARGIENLAGPDAQLAAMAWAQNFGDPLRRALGRPVGVTSWFRSPELNVRIGGSSGSQHCRGEAVDIHVAGLTAHQIVQVVLQEGIPFDQIIGYTSRPGAPQLHVSFTTRRANRKSMLWSPSKKVYLPWNLTP